MNESKVAHRKRAWFFRDPKMMYVDGCIHSEEAQQFVSILSILKKAVAPATVLLSTALPTTPRTIAQTQTLLKTTMKIPTRPEARPRCAFKP